MPYSHHLSESHSNSKYGISTPITTSRRNQNTSIIRTYAGFGASPLNYLTQPKTNVEVLTPMSRFSNQSRGSHAFSGLGTLPALTRSSQRGCVGSNRNLIVPPKPYSDPFE